jgi:DMSO/TMAO reductase YedYZ molybdopterin-dependent catalytic subunit
LRNFTARSRIFSIVFSAILLFATSGGHRVFAQATAASSGQLSVTGDIPKPLSLSLDDLRRQPRVTVKAMNEHQGSAQEVYEGVSLATLLKQAGAPQGAQIKGAALATYIVAEGADGYRVVLSLAEVDSDFQDAEIIVADTMNGAPLADKIGPLRLVVPHDKRPARWVRMLQSIKIVTVPK